MSERPPARLAVVLSHPTQYYSPWFRWLAAHTNLQLRVFYLWKFGVSEMTDPQFGKVLKWDVDLLTGYESEFVPNVSSRPGADHFRGFNNPELPARLEAWRPDALLLFGYKWLTHLRVLLWAFRRAVPVIFRGDSHFIGRQTPGLLRILPLRILFRRFAAVTYVGKANREYFEKCGVPPRRLFFAPHSIDASLFDSGDERHRAAALALRSQLGLSAETRVVLFAGKLVPAKQPRELLSAFIELARPDTAIVLVGDGEEKPALEALAAAARPGSVHFLPFANQTEMPSRYLLADIFALPSRGLYETWGLAVNEAMHMGVPCLVSDRVGCQQDLVTDGLTGWTFPASDAAALKGKLAAALAAVGDATERERLRAAVIARIAGYTYEQTTSGLMAALGSL